MSKVEINCQSKLNVNTDQCEINTSPNYYKLIKFKINEQLVHVQNFKQILKDKEMINNPIYTHTLNSQELPYWAYF